MRIATLIHVSLACAALTACAGQPRSVRALLQQLEDGTDPAARTALVERLLAQHPAEATPDPRNPRRVRTFVGERSEIRMPFLAAQPEIEGPAPAVIGMLSEERFESRALAGSRRACSTV
jgi:hypothetical protein